MITLYTFRPFLGTPDSSPFVIKTMVLLKLAGLRYREQTGGLFRAPKGLLPYIDDAGETIADSSFIRFHLEQKYHLDFDAGLSAADRAIAWSIEKMVEDHLYFALLDLRWTNRANFARGIPLGLWKYLYCAEPARLYPYTQSRSLKLFIPSANAAVTSSINCASILFT